MSVFTTEQNAIIEEQGGNILVSAAAGSGKTTVMVERITKRIREGKVSVPGLLVLTFTDAAAANMKAKITKSIHEAIRLASTPAERMRLSQQALHLPYARISTIHAFCLSVVREYAYLLDPDIDGVEIPDANFRIADQTESDELFRSAVDSVMEEFYMRLEDLDAENQEAIESDEELESAYTDKEKEEARDFLLLLDSYAGSKSDEAIKNAIKQCYAFLRSMPDYTSWVEKELAEVELAGRDFNLSRAAGILRKRLITAITAEEDALKELYSILLDPSTKLLSTKTKTGQVNNEEAKADCLSSLMAIRELERQLIADPSLPYNDIRNLLRKCLFKPVRKSKGNEARSAVSDLIRYRMSAITGFFEKHKNAPRGTLPAFALEQEDIEDDIRAMYPVLRALFMLVLKTDKRYTILKNEQAAIDFNDFEHIALALLRKAEVIDLYVNEIQEIYVDEYQDTSSIQNTIIEAVGRNNIFVVGDIKQSIYRFRHARPELFNRKMAAYAANPAEGIIHLMSQNFRSVGGILEAVNSVFERVMEESTGEINYLDGHALRAFHPDEPNTPQPAEFILIDRGQKHIPDDVSISDSETETAASEDDLTDEKTEADDQEYEELGALEEEGRLIADIIRKEGYGLGNPLAPEFGDITILCMTHDHAKAVSGELIRQGLPVSGEEDSGYLEANELRLMEAVIQLLGNELQDIPLLSCMRRLPVYGGFTDEELMEIKAFSLRSDSKRNPYEHYHEAVSYYLEYGPEGDLRHRLNRFKDWIRSLREASVYLSLNELITRIYRESGLLEAVAAESDGGKRVANLQNFRDWAASYEARGHRGLSYFVKYLEEKRERGITISPFEEGGETDGSIRVITFHKSKGLEFPLVFLVGLNRGLVSSSRKGTSFVDLSEKGGISFQIRRPDRILAYPSIITQTYKEEMNDAEFAESMRLLYVAMTRAEKKLYLIASPDRGITKKSSSFQDRLAYFANRNLRPDIKLAGGETREAYQRRDLLSATTYADLIFMSQIANCPESYEHFSRGEGGSSIVIGPWRFVNLNTGQDWPFKRSVHSSMPHEREETSDVMVGGDSESYIDEQAVKDICRSYLEAYPYQRATVTPQKFAVSELKRRMQEDILNLGDQDEHLAAEATDGKALPGLSGAGINTQLDDWLGTSAQEKKAGIRELAANERGTALHTVLRFLDIQTLRGKSLHDIEAALSELLDQTVLDEEEYQAVLPYTEKILAYVNSNIAKEILDAELSNGHVYREIPFTLAEPLKTFFPEEEYSNDKVLIQGIIDLWFTKDGESFLLDYKSDVLSGTQEERIRTLSERYRLQLELYSRAIYAATGKRVRKRLIWSIPDARIYEIEKMDI